jgi:hypothetical protein
MLSNVFLSVLLSNQTIFFQVCSSKFESICCRHKRSSLPSKLIENVSPWFQLSMRYGTHAHQYFDWAREPWLIIIVSYDSVWLLSLVNRQIPAGYGLLSRGRVSGSSLLVINIMRCEQRGVINWSMTLVSNNYICLSFWIETETRNEAETHKRLPCYWFYLHVTPFLKPHMLLNHDKL